MSIITLTTDYGERPLCRCVEGKLSEYPEASIIDISHHIDPFNTVGQLHYWCGYSGFPKGTVHLIELDMELNKENQHIVMQWNDSYVLPITAFLMLSAKIVPQRMVAINSTACQ
jgi:S-adenosylmethionine hydrolase